MIRRSDNNATTRLWNRVGGARAIAWIQQAARSKDTVIAPENPAWWGYTRTTAADMTALLTRMGPPRATPPAAFVLNEMRHVVPEQRWGIPEGAPDPAGVSVKNGWFPEEDSKVWRVHSVGFVPGPNPIDGGDSGIGLSEGGVVISILTRYPLALGFDYGKETCGLVAREILTALLPARRPAP